MNIEDIIEKCRDVIAAHEAHAEAKLSSDTWDVVCAAESTLLAMDGVPRPTAQEGTLALAKLVVAASRERG